jgi:Mn2+/Fe2+ NRAMP family transporter
LRRVLGALGPGIIAGASDDDPSAIATYSIVGASQGYRLLWAPLVALPLVLAVQWMCARMEMVTGRGLAAAIRSRYGLPVALAGCGLLAFANTLQVGADLAGMGEVLMLATGVPTLVWPPILAIVLFALLAWSSHRRIGQVLKWLVLVLLAYVGAAFLSCRDWLRVWEATVAPELSWQPDYLSMLLGIIGSILSPYIFFWQGEQMVEDHDGPPEDTAERQAAVPGRLGAAWTDVTIGMAFACAIAYFIILTTAATLFERGEYDVQTAEQAASALRPIAGAGAAALFSIGILAAGLLGLPALAASTAFALCETFGVAGGSLDRNPREAPLFYAILAAGFALGTGLNYLGIAPVRMLFMAAVVNGIFAAPLLAVVCLLSGDRLVMGRFTASPGLRLVGGLAALLVAIAAVVMLVSSI